jgi:hypothetical protein
MTTRQVFRWIEMCSNCKRHGEGHQFDCTCHRHATTIEPPMPGRVPSMSPFTLLQLERDKLDRRANQAGDLCKRWVTCTRCWWTSDPVGMWSDMDKVEDDHMLHGCPAPAPGYSPDDDLIWPSQRLPWVFTYRIEPADEVTGRGIRRDGHGMVAGRRAPIVLHLPERDAA